MKRVRVTNFFFRGKATSFTCSEYLSQALVIQHTVRMRPVILSSVASLFIIFSPTLSHKQHDFRKQKRVAEHNMCVLIFSTTFV